MVSNISSPVSERIEQREWLISAGAVVLFMLLFIWQAKIYDLSTAAFFAYGLGFLARGKVAAFLMLFPSACLNRETTLLLSMVYTVWCFGKMGWWKYLLGGMYQAVTFGAIRWWVVQLYASNPGVDFMWRPIENLRLFGEHPLWTIFHWWIFAAIVWTFLRRRNLVPPFVRCAFLVLFPVMLVNYLLLGWSFEVRVFWEIVPVIVGMMKDEGVK